jgi:hypothetical protein
MKKSTKVFWKEHPKINPGSCPENQNPLCKSRVNSRM